MESKKSSDSLSMSNPSSPPEYEPLRGKDSDSVDGLDMLPLHRSAASRRHRRYITLAKLLSGVVLVAFIVLPFALSFHTVELLGKIGALVKTPKPSAGQRSYKFPCGNTASEAAAKGCIFDIMSMAWQSPECYDEDLAAEFADLGPWEFYSDPQQSQLLSYAQVS